MAGNNSCVVGHTESAVDWRGATDESGVAAQPLPTFDTPRDWPNASVSSLADAWGWTRRACSNWSRAALGVTTGFGERFDKK